MYIIRDIDSGTPELSYYVGVIDDEPRWGVRDRAKRMGVVTALLTQKRLANWPGRPHWEVALLRRDNA